METPPSQPSPIWRYARYLALSAGVALLAVAALDRVFLARGVFFGLWLVLAGAVFVGFVAAARRWAGVLVATAVITLLVIAVLAYRLPYAAGSGLVMKWLVLTAVVFVGFVAAAARQLAGMLVATAVLALLVIAVLTDRNPYLAERGLALAWLGLTAAGLGGLVAMAVRPPRPWGRLAALTGAWILAAGLASHATLQRIRIERAAMSVATWQLRAAAEQFFLEEPTRVFVEFDEVVGPSRYVKWLGSSTPDNYREMFPLRADFDEMPVTIKDGYRVVVLAESGVWVLLRPDGTVETRGRHARNAEANTVWLAAQRRHDGVVVTTPRQGGRFETTWRGGVRDGPFRAYYADGKLWAEAAYVRGRLAGRHVVYNRTGRVIHEKHFGRPAP